MKSLIFSWILLLKFWKLHRFSNYNTTCLSGRLNYFPGCAIYSLEPAMLRFCSTMSYEESSSTLCCYRFFMKYCWAKSHSGLPKKSPSSDIFQINSPWITKSCQFFSLSWYHTGFANLNSILYKYQQTFCCLFINFDSFLGNQFFGNRPKRTRTNKTRPAGFFLRDTEKIARDGHNSDIDVSLRNQFYRI